MTEPIKLPVVTMPHAKDLPLPQYATEGAAGLDLLAALEKPITLKPRQRDLIPTGIQIAIPPGYEAQVRPRSGLALKHGLTILNTPGTIDCDYRGEVKAILINLGTDDFQIERGMRIAQLVIAPTTKAILTETATLDATERGTDGFGSTETKTPQ